MMTKLSIIIPMYNTPTEDLQRCFDSIAEPAWEVLLIDDGSEPHVGDFCKAYVATHPNFQYYYQENGGVSSARNLGIQKATGEYLTFLDADDRLLPGVLEKHLSGEDLILFDMQLTQLGKDSVWSAFPLPQGQLTREQVLYQLCTSSSISGPVAKLYRTQLIAEHMLRFDTEFITGEDWMFVCDYAMVCESYRYVKVPAYQYFRSGATSEGRLTRSPDTMLKNLVARYDRKLQVMAQHTWTEYSGEQARDLAAREFIENLFNAAATLRLKKLLTSRRRTLIRRNAARAADNATHIPGKTRTKLWILGKFPAMLYPMALLRKLYLKFKY